MFVNQNKLNIKVKNKLNILVTFAKCLVNLLFSVNCCNVITINFCFPDSFRVNFSPTYPSCHWYFSVHLYWPCLPCHYCGMEST